MAIAGTRRGLQVRAQPGQAEVAVPQDEHLAGHQKKPSAGHGNHRIPDQANRRIRQLQLPEPLPGGKTKHPRRLPQFPRQALQRGIETERHVPHLPGKDQQDSAQLNAQLAPGNQRDHGQHHRRQKAQHRDRLQNIERRDHERFGPRSVRGDVAVSHGERQAQQVRHRDAHNRIERVQRQHLR